MGGILKCPRCGSSDVRFDLAGQSLVCASCRNAWREPLLSADPFFATPVNQLTGVQAMPNAVDMATDAATITMKCTSCGAEVVINTNETVQARCHWCRSTLSIDARIHNGAVPDGVVPFTVPQNVAVGKIAEFVNARKFFAHPRFRREFRPENVVGVYLPFFAFSGNGSGSLLGEGEIETRRWTRQVNKETVTYYDADRFQVGRSFGLSVENMLMEGERARADIQSSSTTNNIINTLLPFDLSTAVRYNPSYLRGFTSERRDRDIGDLSGSLNQMLLSVARTEGDEMTANPYGRGVRWDYEKATVNGARWLTVYLPVWIYSYYQKDVGIMHYVAVNGQNGNVMGSVPVNKSLLLSVSWTMSIIGGAVALAAIIATHRL